MNRVEGLALAFLFLVGGLAARAGMVEIKGAPFEMPPIAVPEFAQRDFPITDYGARPDGGRPRVTTDRLTSDRVRGDSVMLDPSARRLRVRLPVVQSWFRLAVFANTASE